MNKFKSGDMVRVVKCPIHIDSYNSGKEILITDGNLFENRYVMGKASWAGSSLWSECDLELVSRSNVILENILNN